MKKSRAIHLIAIILIVGSFTLIALDKQPGVMIAILFTVLGYYFKHIYDEYGREED